MAPYERCAGYVLLRELGQDALGAVYRAGHLAGGAIDRLVLLRKLRVDGVPAATIAQSAAAREELSRRVRSPYLAELVELGTCGGEAFAAYDYQAGVTARQLLTLADDRLSPLAPDLAAVIADRAAQALMALWAAGEPGHGLVVPELIWISTEGEVRLLGAEAAPALSRAGSRADLLPFVAPEARGGAAPVEVDEVWSLGALLAALLTGVAPEPDDDGAWLARATLAEDGAPLPEPIAELLGRSLVSRPQRLAHVEAWHQALSRALELVGWRTAPFQLAVYMHTLLKNEMKREPAELERERQEAVGGGAPVAAGAVAAALPPVGRPAEPGRGPANEARPAPAAPLEGPRLLGALGKEESPEERPSSRRWLPWAALGALAVAAGAAYLLLSGRGGEASRVAPRAATAGPPAAAAPAPAPAAAAAVSPTVAPPAAAELEQRLARLMEEQQKTLSDRYTREVEQLRDQLAESRRATAAAAASRPLPSAGRAEAGGTQGAATVPRADAGRETSAPAAPPEPAPAAPSAAAAPAAGTPPPRPAAADDPRAAPAAPSSTQLVPPRLLRFDPPDYPQLARQRGVEGTVVLSVRVATSGQVTEVRFVRRVPQDAGLNEAAAAAARRARFQPATRAGVPAEAWYTLTIPFQL